MSDVEGTERVVDKIIKVRDRMRGQIMEAIEKTAVRMAEHAKAGHEHGSSPHTENRFETQTGNLVNSVFPSGVHPMEWENTEDEIVGLFGVSPRAMAVMDYAAKVESQYPFIWPAAIAKKDDFVKEVFTAAAFAVAEVKGF